MAAGNRCRCVLTTPLAGLNLLEQSGSGHSAFESTRLSAVARQVSDRILGNTMFEVRCMVDSKDVLGECPVWCPEEQVLWWIDVSRPALYRLDTTTGDIRTRILPKPIGSITLCQGGGLLLAFRSGLASMETMDSPLQWVELPGTRPQDARFNDGKCDSKGRLWIGSMDRNLKSPIGELYRIERTEQGFVCTTMDSGFTISNGIGWSPDERTMYFTDSPARRIYAYDFDAVAGKIANRRVFVQFDDDPGRPDGCAVDAEGFVWSARVHGWRLDRYDPQGRLERTIPLSFERPTSLVFGGPKLETLYVTSSNMSFSAEELSRQPQAGGLFAIETGIKGQHEHRFSG